MNKKHCVGFQRILSSVSRLWRLLVRMSPYAVFLCALMTLGFYLLSSNFHKVTVCKVFSNSLDSMRPTPDVARVLFFVLSNPTDEEQRTAVRTSWRHWLWLYGGRVQMRFFLGQQDSPEVNESLHQEQTVYGDLVQLDQFTDTYFNLSLKVLYGMQYAIHHFPNLKYIVKTDVDVFVNVPNLLAEIWQARRRSESPFFILGFEMEESVPNRDEHDKWFTPPETYAGDVYPNYMDGPCYVLTRETAALLVEHGLTSISKNMTHVKWEDVLFTGIWRNEVNELRPLNRPGIVLVDSRNFNLFLSPNTWIRYLQLFSWDATRWTSLHKMNPEDMKCWWERLSCHRTHLSPIFWI